MPELKVTADHLISSVTPTSISANPHRVRLLSTLRVRNANMRCAIEQSQSVGRSNAFV